MALQTNIRKYQAKDKPFLIGILKQLVPTYFAENEINDFENYLDHEIEQYFVVEVNRKIIGSGGINFENDFKTGKISWDFIAPEYHGKGIGELLLNHRINILKSMPDIDSIRVRTSQLSYTFYEKNGFVIQEIIKDYWAPGFDLYQMKYQ